MIQRQDGYIPRIPVPSVGLLKEGSDKNVHAYERISMTGLGEGPQIEIGL